MDKSAALIGHTGFVGRILDDARFSDRFNSKNVETARGRHFGEVICAGVQAVKWWANQNPEADWAGIEPLLEVLGTITAERFVLISTVDVFRDPTGADEATPVDTEGLHAYGRHRHAVEEFVRRRFGDGAVIVRLAGLFGPGLKKNVIFDLLQGRDVAGFNPASTFQFYDMARLANDLAVIEAAQLGLAHLAVEPVSVAEVGAALGADAAGFGAGAPVVSYDMQTLNGRLWGQEGRYMATAADTLARIAEFGRGWRRP